MRHTIFVKAMTQALAKNQTYKVFKYMYKSEIGDDDDDDAYFKIVCY